MSPPDPVFDGPRIKLTVEIIRSYVRGNKILPDHFPKMVENIYKSLGAPGEPTEYLKSTRIPAVPISKTIYRDFIVCLEDGKKVKLLKRYIRMKYQLTPDEYRRRWGLPNDYPMVAPGYADRRSQISKRSYKSTV